jgi:hypothetical protein
LAALPRSRKRVDVSVPKAVALVNFPVSEITARQIYLPKRAGSTALSDK